MSASIVFYYASGSPYAWRVWLALDVRRMPFERKLLSFDAGDLQKPDFAALNPRQRVPVIVDGDLVLRESAAIVEYLDEREAPGNRLFGKEPKARARQRQMIREADNYLARRMEEFAELLFADGSRRSAAQIAEAAAGLQGELEFCASRRPPRCRRSTSRSFRSWRWSTGSSRAPGTLRRRCRSGRRCRNGTPGSRPTTTCATRGRRTGSSGVGLAAT